MTLLLETDGCSNCECRSGALSESRRYVDTGTAIAPAEAFALVDSELTAGGLTLARLASL